MKKIIILVLLALCILFLSEKNYVIPSESIRFRIIPNSNSREDIAIKEEATKDIISILGSIDERNIDDSREGIIKNMNTIEKKLNDIFEENNYEKNFNIKYGLNYFPIKKYKGITYDEGYYESLVIEIGESKGNNYWCVLYPPLCLIDESADKTKYKSKIIEVINKVFNVN